MVILVLRTGYLRVTHPFAMAYRSKPFDLHVLGTPPALILSQDQTLQKIYLFLVFLPFAHSNNFILNCVFFHSFFASSYIVFKDLFALLTNALLYLTTPQLYCQHIFYLFYCFYLFSLNLLAFC